MTWYNTWKSTMTSPKKCSVAQLCPTLRPHGLQHTRFHNLPEFAQTDVHWVSDPIQPFCPQRADRMRSVRCNKQIQLSCKAQNQQTKFCCVYIHKQWANRNIKKAIPCIITTKRIKSLRIHLTKKVKGLFTENYKTLLKKTAGKSKWKAISCSQIGRIN